MSRKVAREAVETAVSLKGAAETEGGSGDCLTVLVGHTDVVCSLPFYKQSLVL